MKTKVDPFDYPEKYRLPIVIYESDIQQERAYLQLYNEEYMSKDTEKKNQKSYNICYISPHTKL